MTNDEWRKYAIRNTQYAIRAAFRVTPWPAITVVGLMVLYIATFGLLAARRHLAYETSAFDLGNYDQALWNAAHGRGLALTTLPSLTLNRLGLHVEPILFLFVPLYWLWPNPLGLLWLQTLALGLAAWPLFLLARGRLGSEWPAVAIVLAYLLLPATQSVNLFDFHAVALSPLFMLTAIYFLDRALAGSGNRAGFWLGPPGPSQKDSFSPARPAFHVSHKGTYQSRFTFHVSRFTFHVSPHALRATHYALWAALFFI